MWNESEMLAVEMVAAVAELLSLFPEAIKIFQNIGAIILSQFSYNFISSFRCWCYSLGHAQAHCPCLCVFGKRFRRICCVAALFLFVHFSHFLCLVDSILRMQIVVTAWYRHTANAHAHMARPEQIDLWTGQKRLNYCLNTLGTRRRFTDLVFIHSTFSKTKTKRTKQNAVKRFIDLDVPLNTNNRKDHNSISQTPPY